MRHSTHGHISTSIDIVLPCYNPIDGWADNIITSFNKLKDALSPISVNLIIVNDGSNPPIREESISRLKTAIPQLSWLDQHPNQGKGAALREGMKSCQSEFIVFTDIDFPYTMDSTIGLCQEVMKNEGDIVVGQRRKKYYEKTPWQREAISKLLKAFNKHILRIPVSDTQCGLKGFNRKGLAAFRQTSVNRYLFDLEFLIIAGTKKHRLTVVPFDVELREGVTFSKLNFKILLTESQNIIRIVLKKWFG